jgi:hypothetical protein
MTFVGVQGTGRVIAERGQPMVSSTSSTAARARVRRSHFCVDWRDSYGRLERGTGVEVAATDRVDRRMQVTCALPAPCGLPCLNFLIWCEQSVQ